MENVYVDTSKFNLKLSNVKRAFEAQARISLTKAAQTIYKGAAANLAGPSYGVRTTSGGLQVHKRGPLTNAGKFPVPRPTGTLARSLKMQPLPSTIGFAVFSDPQVAYYAKWVHDGTKKMPARRYLGDVVKSKKAQLSKDIDKELRQAIRNVGI